MEDRGWDRKEEGEAMTREFVYGVDLGWVSQLESQGVCWIDGNGEKTDPIIALKAMGANAVRLRVFVDPPKEAYWRKPCRQVGIKRSAEKNVCLVSVIKKAYFRWRQE